MVIFSLGRNDFNECVNLTPPTPALVVAPTPSPVSMAPIPAPVAPSDNPNVCDSNTRRVTVETSGTSTTTSAVLLLRCGTGDSVGAEVSQGECEGSVSGVVCALEQGQATTVVIFNF